MHTAKRLTVAALCVLGLSAFRYPTQLSAPADVPAPAYRFADERPPQQLKSGFESLAITNCAYGSVRVGDRDIAPTPAVVVQDALNRRFGERLSGRAVTLKNFTLHLNNVAVLRGQMGRMYPGIIPDMLNDQAKLGCAADDLRGGYLASEIGPEQVPVIVVVDVEVDGRRFHARTLLPQSAALALPPPPNLPPKASAKPEVKAEWNRVVDAAVTKALAQLGDRIEQELFSAAVAPASGDVSVPAKDAVVATPVPGQ
jgi:hypothetical protein